MCCDRGDVIISIFASGGHLERDEISIHRWEAHANYFPTVPEYSSIARTRQCTAVYSTHSLIDWLQRRYIQIQFQILFPIVNHESPTSGLMHIHFADTITLGLHTFFLSSCESWINL